MPPRPDLPIAHLACRCKWRVRCGCGYATTLLGDLSTPVDATAEAGRRHSHAGMALVVEPIAKPAAQEVAP